MPQLSTTPISYKPPVGENEFTLGVASAKLTSEGSGRLVVIATNLGDAPLDATSTPLTFTDRLPKDVTAYGAEGFAGGQGSAGPMDCVVREEKVEEEEGGATETISLVECSFEGELPPYEAIEVEIPVALQEGAGAQAGEVVLSGGDGPTERITQTVNVSGAPVAFGFEHFSARAEEEGGGPSTQAARHPFQLTNTVQFNSGKLLGGSNRREATVQQPGLPRNTRVVLPAGFAGSAKAVNPCPLADFSAIEEGTYNRCPASSAVGVASVTTIESLNFGLLRLAVPIFALPPAHGEPARFGFLPVGVPVVIDTSVDPGDGYRIHAEVRNAPQVAQVLSATLSIWGIPGDPRHDASRGWGCVLFTHPVPCEGSSEEAQTPLLRVPVSCGTALRYPAEAEAWNAPAGEASHAEDEGPPLAGCNKVPFDPEISNALTSRLASNPSGLDFGLDLPNQWLSGAKPEAIAEGQPKRVEVALPTGVTINPSQAEGLATCTEADYARERYDSRPGEGCPEASKIGSVQVSTPLLDEQAQGALYVATPYENPTGAMIALYLVAKIPDRGILVKQVGKVEPDPATGRLVSTFDDIPQLPFDSFKLHFREGGRSPLITPPGCGSSTRWRASPPGRPPTPTTPPPPKWSNARPPSRSTTASRAAPAPPAPRPFTPASKRAPKTTRPAPTRPSSCT